MKNQQKNDVQKQKKKIPFQTNGLKAVSVSVHSGAHPEEHAALEKPEIGLDSKKLERTTAILNATLANQQILYFKTRNFHWNLIGRRFHTLHLFLEEQYKILQEAVDATAERVRMVGGVAHGSMEEYLATCTLQEESGHLIQGDDAIGRLLSDHEQIIIELRKNIKELDEKVEDAGNADFLTDLLKQHEETAWMLRSHLI